MEHLLGEFETKRPLLTQTYPIEIRKEQKTKLEIIDTSALKKKEFINQISWHSSKLHLSISQTILCPDYRKTLVRVDHSWTDEVFSVNVCYVPMVGVVLKENLGNFDDAQQLLDYWADNRFGYCQAFTHGHLVHLHKAFSYHQDDYPNHVVVSFDQDILHFPGSLIGIEALCALANCGEPLSGL